MAARGVSAKVKLRKAALDEAVRIVADGAFEAGRVIVERASANAPDSPYDPYPTGEGLPKQGGVLAYVGGEKVDGWSIRGPQPAKPRSVRMAVKQRFIAVIVGFGFPARFAEGGTIHQPAQPFLGPARDALGPSGVSNIIGEVTRPQIGRAK